MSDILLTDVDNHVMQLSRSFLIRVESIYSELKSAEKRALDTIIKEPDLLANSTIAQVAEVAQCSEATFIRLSRKLGFKGFPGMKVGAYSGDIAESSYPSIDLRNTTNEIMKEFFSIAKSSLDDTLVLNTAEQIDKCTNLIINANLIQFIGAGDAYMVANAGFLKFYRAGYGAMCSPEYDVQLIETSKLNVNDVIIAISHSGLTKSICELIKNGKKKGANIIGITSKPLSRLAKLSDIVLLTPAFTQDTYNEILAQRIPASAIIEVLYILTKVRSAYRPQESIQQANYLLSKNKYGE